MYQEAIAARKTCRDSYEQISLDVPSDVPGETANLHSSVARDSSRSSVRREDAPRIVQPSDQLTVHVPEDPAYNRRASSSSSAHGQGREQRGGHDRPGSRPRNSSNADAPVVMVVPVSVRGSENVADAPRMQRLPPSPAHIPVNLPFQMPVPHAYDNGQWQPIPYDAGATPARPKSLNNASGSREQRPRVAPLVDPSNGLLSPGYMPTTTTRPKSASNASARDQPRYEDPDGGLLTPGRGVVRRNKSDSAIPQVRDQDQAARSKGSVQLQSSRVSDDWREQPRLSRESKTTREARDTREARGTRDVRRPGAGSRYDNISNANLEREEYVRSHQYREGGPSQGPSWYQADHDDVKQYYVPTPKVAQTGKMYMVQPQKSRAVDLLGDSDEEVWSDGVLL